MSLPAPDFERRLADVARGLLEQPGVEPTLQRSVELTRDHVSGADCVSISLVQPRRGLATSASTDPWAEQADELQHALDEGPCLDAVHREEVVAVGDLMTVGARTYPRWAPAVVAATGIRSSLSVRLRTTRQTLGALNVYSTRTAGLSDTDRSEAQVVAAQIALALNAARQIVGLRVGMEGRTVIGQAEGILMERFKISASDAFEMLSRVSQDTNTRLREVAARLVDTGETPTSPRRR